MVPLSIFHSGSLALQLQPNSFPKAVLQELSCLHLHPCWSVWLPSKKYCGFPRIRIKVVNLGTGKIWILVSDWSRLKSSEPNAGHLTCKIGPLYSKLKFVKELLKFIYSEKATKILQNLVEITFKYFSNITHQMEIFAQEFELVIFVIGFVLTWSWGDKNRAKFQ